MNRPVAVITVATIAAVSLTCADHSTAARVGQLARLAITPLFEVAPDGGPHVDVHKIKGQLTRLNGTDSVTTEALVEGDSAILEFSNVLVRGDSTAYALTLQAFDTQDSLVFKGGRLVKVKPGDNVPDAPALQYAAADKIVDAIEIKSGSTPVDTVRLDWAGADPTNTLCLNKVPNALAVTAQQLRVYATANGQAVASVRVGWRSRDPRVAAVDSTGLVQARCSNKSTYVVARTFLNVTDSVLINVAAPAFSFVMDPDSVTLERGATRQFTALVVDENNNTTPATQPTWGSSDVTRATVSASGLVQALRNGRVNIGASAGNRITVGVVQVVRPHAVAVKVIPGRDTMAFGQVQQYFARAFDANGHVIADAAPFQWFTSNSSIATVDPATGVVRAQQTADTVFIKAEIDGVFGKAILRVMPALPTGSVSSLVKDASTGLPIANATITAPVCTTSSVTDGSFTISCLKSGDSLLVADSGYAPVRVFDVPAFPNKTTQMPNIPLSPAAPGAVGTMTSKILNALTGSGVSGMTIKAYAGLHAAPSPRRPDVTPVATATSDANGVFTISAEPGAYTLVASGTGYSDAVGVGTSVAGVTKQTPPIIVPPVIPGGGLFIMVTWDDCSANPSTVPCDLDAHLTGPMSATDTTRFQVYSGNKSYVDPTSITADTIAALDAQKSASPGKGPEVIGLRTAATPGIYRFYVKDVANATSSTSTMLATSGARVDVFQDNHVIASFSVPPALTGGIWHVFTYDGARLIPINQATPTTTPNTLP